MTNDFLPPNYEVPSSREGYMKLQKGESRFRILSSPIMGYEYWTTVDGKRKPNRVKMGDPIPEDQLETNEKGELEMPKHFWAMIVFNYAVEKVQILEITQVGIQKTLRALAKDKDWGTPVMTYDIVVTKVGEGFNTTYNVLPKPAKELDKGIVQLYKDMKINLNALYDNKDPFSSKDEDVDPKDVKI